MKDVSLRIIFATAFLAASSLLVAIGCNGASKCSDDSDCFAGEACVYDRCAVASDDGDTGGMDADAGEDSTTEDTTESDTGEDATTEDTVEEDAGDSGEDALDASTDGPACVVDKFVASCPDSFAEPNESSTRGFALNENRTLGCPTADDFQSLSESHSTWICANESQDWYKAIVYPCDSTSFVIEARVTPKTACSRDLWEAGPRNYECTDQNISCSWDGETYVVRRFFDAGGISGTSYYFGIKKITDSLESEQEVQLEYDVTFETRR